MAKRELEPDSGVYAESVNGSLTYNDLSAGEPALATMSTPKPQRSGLRESESEMSLDADLASLPSGGVEAKVRDLQDENTNLKHEVKTLKAKVRELEDKVSDFDDHKENCDMHKSETTESLNSLQKSVDESSTANTKLKDENRQLTRQVACLTGRVEEITRLLQQQSLNQTAAATENDQARAAQERTNLALVGGANLQYDSTKKVKEEVTELKKESKEEMRQLKSEMHTAQLTANNALQAFNENNLPGGLQQADNNDEDGEPVSDGDS